MPPATLNRRQSSAGQQRRRHLLLPLLATVLALAGLVTSAPAKRNASPFAFNVLQTLIEVNSTWHKPCGKNAEKNTVNDTSFNTTTTKFIIMEDQINLTLLDLNNWRDLPGSNNSVTTWNDTLRKRQFKFLEPFLKKESSWERRLSVYWAYLKVIRVFQEKYPEATNIKRDEKDALASVNEATRQLLCMVQEYRVMTRRNYKQINPTQMERKIKFNIQDASEIKIHIWYIMCRLECFLKNMRKHLRQSSVGGTQEQNRNGVEHTSCKACPYCNKLNKQCKPPKKKHRKQGQHQQQRQHNRPTGQRAQQAAVQPTVQHQPSRQPKGRKGTRTPNNHARNKQG